MQMGMVGLGRMGASMVRRLMRGGHECVVYDVNADAVARVVKEGARGTSSLDAFAAALKKPRVAWMMVPAAVVEQTVGRSVTPVRTGRHHRRRRQLALHRRHSPREGVGHARHSLRGCRHEWRRLGPRARLLPDDRRRAGHRAAPRSAVCDAGAGRRFGIRARPVATRSRAGPRSTAICIAGRTAPVTS